MNCPLVKLRYLWGGRHVGRSLRSEDGRPCAWPAWPPGLREQLWDAGSFLT